MSEFRKTGDTPSETNPNGAPLLGDSRDLFRPKASDIPAQPGVYKWRDADGRVIYVGKAKNLRSRLSNYFQPLENLHPRTQSMVLTARSLEWTVVGTELESLTLEYTWIKEFDPRFNVVFRDDKTYPYLAISVNEEIPRIWVTRNRNRRGTRYFGPYAKVWNMRKTLDSLLHAYPVRTCTPSVFHKAQVTGRPCLLAYIGKCSAPCVGWISPQDHRQLCEQVIGILTGKLGKAYARQLTGKMQSASAELDFEAAAKLRDQITALSSVLEQNSVVLDDSVDADIFGLASDELEASVHCFFVRAGTIRGERSWSVERVEDVDDSQVVSDLIPQVYSDLAEESRRQEGVSIAVSRSRDALAPSQQVTAKDAVSRAQVTRKRRSRQEETGRDDLLSPISPVPREVLVPVLPSRKDELEAWLSGIRGSAVSVRVASRGEKRTLMERANTNAQQTLMRIKSSRMTDMGMRTQALNEIAEALGLKEAPLRIECYDISNASGGGYQVASMVVFEDGIARKKEYRHFAIRGKDGQGAADDTSAIYETLTRRFKHGNIAGDSGQSIEEMKRIESTRRTQGPQGDRDIPDVPADTGPQAGRADAGQKSLPAKGTEAQNAGDIQDPAAVVQQDTDRRHFAYTPNLIVVDGGKPQANAAARALEDLNVSDVAVCGLAKKLEEIWLPDDRYPVIMKRQSEGMYLMQRVRDESHRFAIAYHRKKRSKGLLTSILDNADGIGETFQKKLLAHFGSVKAIRAASIEQIREVRGIGAKKAEAVYSAVHASQEKA